MNLPGIPAAFFLFCCQSVFPMLAVFASHIEILMAAVFCEFPGTGEKPIPRCQMASLQALLYLCIYRDLQLFTDVIPAFL